VTSPRRLVRPLPDFLLDLDHQLGEERGPHDEPSRYDFLSLELPGIMETFAVRWDDLPPLIRGRSDYRILIGTWRLVPAYSVEAQLSPRGIVELVRIDLQLAWPENTCDAEDG
jgi:hypothetical protein